MREPPLRGIISRSLRSHTWALEVRGEGVVVADLSSPETFSCPEIETRAEMAETKEVEQEKGNYCGGHWRGRTSLTLFPQSKCIFLSHLSCLGIVFRIATLPLPSTETQRIFCSRSLNFESSLPVSHCAFFSVFLLLHRFHDSIVCNAKGLPIERSILVQKNLLCTGTSSFFNSISYDFVVLPHQIPLPVRRVEVPPLAGASALRRGTALVAVGPAEARRPLQVVALLPFGQGEGSDEEVPRNHKRLN